MEKVQGWEVFALMSLVIISAFVTTVQAQSKSFLINCGTNSSVNVDGRRWVGDLVHDGNLTLSSPSIAASTAALSDSSNFGPLYKTARFFTDSLNYTFKGIQGNYFVRLHFCPFSFGNYNVNESAFDVVANGLKLVSKFNVPSEISHKNSNLQSSGSNSSSFFFIKEYILPINTDVLVVEFLPVRGSLGFINAIEIVPIVDKLFADSISRVGDNSVNLSGRSIQTMYRLNVGGSEVKSNQDSNLWRTWEVDSSYMITANAGSEISNSSNITYAFMNDSSVAPLLVYETARTMSNTGVLEKRFNMSWKFEVDPDFEYLIRLHFCELVFDVPKQRIFRIYINNRTAADNFEVFERSGGLNKAYHQDYIDAVSSKTKTLWIQLGPETAAGAAGTDALLNGLEIFKLSQSGSLAYVEPYDSTGNSVGNSKTKILWVGIGAGVTSAVILGVIISFIYCFCRRQREKLSDTKNNSPGWRPLFLNGSILNNSANGKRATGSQYPYGSVASTRVGKRFTLPEICAATNNFDDSLVIGVGGFGKVYKGEIEDGTLVAIKRSNPQSEQGLAEFETEIEMLSKLRHRHLVSMIGFCDEQNEMILVYEYMANGTLRKWAMGWQRQRSLETIIDSHLKGNYSPESLKKFGEIAEKCLADEGKNRPTMGEVLWYLEYVLQLQEAWMYTNNAENSFSSSQALGVLEEAAAEKKQEPHSLDEENNSGGKMISCGTNPLQNLQTLVLFWIEFKIFKDMEKLGRELVARCVGLPLAIIVLGGLLATKETLDKWDIGHRNIKLHLGKGQGEGQQSRVHEVLALSYFQLHYQLKPCFLYLSHFPEDFDIPTKKLVRLWVAKGFVPLKYELEGDEMLEDYAEPYLVELINRCVVQMGVIGSNVWIKSCCLHDLKRDLCLSKAKQENFLHILSP
ncbi:hypothetical protein SO802_006965 [Lithocarpus litseifolius]|uniref:Protein kinase domain-containing protein n=1 Tax=Lithocarpus litseifolius TaxID=425828 RepID=A0AAW2DMB7_9ROSI